MALTVVVEAPLLRGGTALALDAATQFVPWYAWLGEQLRGGSLPGWNPHTFSGMPFAGAPLSGWGYLPAMLLYTVLPPGLATAAYLVSTLALAGVGMYLLARALRMPVIGALVAAVAFELSGYLFLQNPCCFAFAQVEAWLPWALLGVEIAARAEGWAGRLPGWALSGLATSQVLAAWLGQGSMYVLLALMGWIFWRSVLDPPAAGPWPGGWRARPARLALHTAAVLGLGLALGAASVLPRLELIAVSSLAGGYPAADGSQAAAVGGWRVGDFTRLASPGIWYMGVAPLALAAAAPFVARRRYAVPFFTLLAVAALVLALARQTPLHAALLAIPVADRLHPHSPERVLLLAFPAIALLAGGTVSALHVQLSSGSGGKPWVKTRGAERRRNFPAYPEESCAFPRGAAGGERGARARWVGVVALIVVTADLAIGLERGVADLRSARRSERLVDVDVGRSLEPSPAGAWLAEAGPAAGAAEEGLDAVDASGPGRYFGYAPQVAGGRARSWAYSVRWTDPQVHALMVNNQAMAAGLADIQGYDPVHIARYDALTRALNGREQDYHFADIRPQGLRSPLLDLLNVRWVLIPSGSPREGDPTRAGELAARLPTVYDDGTVRILARPSALPRAWLVHAARREEPDRALELLASGAVDPAETALVEVEPPPLEATAAGDHVQITHHQPDRIVVETASDAAGLLVLSEVAYPAWRATVDGQDASILVADAALRAVAVPAGAHTIELRFASGALTWGTALTASTALALLGVLWITRR
ncbi:MAG: hypothetical protein ACRDZO_28620 [Egibacteraceae bacterium]